QKSARVFELAIPYDALLTVANAGTGCHHGTVDGALDRQDLGRGAPDVDDFGARLEGNAVPLVRVAGSTAADRFDVGIHVVAREGGSEAPGNKVIAALDDAKQAGIGHASHVEAIASVELHLEHLRGGLGGSRCRGRS